MAAGCSFRFLLNNIGRIGPFLTRCSFRHLSCSDYCNFPPTRGHALFTSSLQQIQKAAAPSTQVLPCHSCSLFYSLAAHIQVKTVVPVYIVVKETAPSYPQAMAKTHQMTKLTVMERWWKVWLAHRTTIQTCFCWLPRWWTALKHESYR